MDKKNRTKSILKYISEIDIIFCGLCLIFTFWLVLAAIPKQVEAKPSAQLLPAETQMATPTPSPTPSPSPTPTPTPTPTPVTLEIEFAYMTTEELYYLAVENGEVEGPSEDHLTAYNGVYYGPSGRETYYNLNMDLVVKYMRDLGYSEEDYPYWVRDDGCKMLGNYIIVAANFKTRPKGTILETSLGTAIVCDTGSFVSNYPNGIDIAVNW
jgi:hypothetical protein